VKPILTVSGVHKRFCLNLKRSLWYGVKDITSDLLGRDQVDLRLRKDEFFAINDVSFDVQPGESVALIGRNGAGKSTLLKMINGLYPPDAGSMTVRGRIAALIELGAGFNPLLTGRENIYINAAVLGMNKADVNRRLDEIIDFAELDRFIDMPLKSYSSGMKVRLGFAVASQLEPELLLIDEVLAVGDATFRAKCHRRLSTLLHNGTAFLLVSHNHHTLLATCSRGIVLNKGQTIADDEITAALHAYEKNIAVEDEEVHAMKSQRGDVGDTGLFIRDIFFRDSEGRRIKEPQTGYPSHLCVQVSADREFDNVAMAVIVRESMHGANPLLALTSGLDECWQTVPTGESELQLTLLTTPLTPGKYVAKISISQKPMFILDAVDTHQFGVDAGRPTGDSQFYCERRWQVVPATTAAQARSVTGV
jgi:lipopolysaccharide transport system ATP-binding protein